MSAIAGTRRSMKELADGTIRVQIDIDPIYRAQFFEIFSQIDMPVAITPLVAEFEQKKFVQEQEADIQIVDKKPLGGPLAKWAGILCNDPLFWEWMDKEMGFIAKNETRAAEIIRAYCDITSRSELDHNKEAGNIFRDSFMQPFSVWKDKVAA